MTLAIPVLVLLTLPAALLPETQPPAPPPGGEPKVATLLPAPPERPLPTRNVKVDVTITDQTGSATPMKKLVSLVLADGRSSLVRSVTTATLEKSAPSPVITTQQRNLPLNVDTAVAITPDRQILLELKFNYGTIPSERAAGATTPGVAAPTFADITAQLNVLLTPGVPVVVSRSADASSDRTVTVEVKADIVK